MKQFSMNKGKTLSLLAMTLLLSSNNHEMSSGLSSVEAFRLAEMSQMDSAIHAHSHSHHKKKHRKKHHHHKEESESEGSEDEKEDQKQKGSSAMVQ